MADEYMADDYELPIAAPSQLYTVDSIGAAVGALEHDSRIFHKANDFEHQLFAVKLDALIAAVNSVGALAEAHERHLKAIVDVVQDFQTKFSTMNPMAMMKSMMGKG